MVGAITDRSAGGLALHVGATLDAYDREGRERLIRYVTRRPIAHHRLSQAPGGPIRLLLETPWRDVTHALLLDELDLIARLAAITEHLAAVDGIHDAEQALLDELARLWP